MTEPTKEQRVSDTSLLLTPEEILEHYEPPTKNYKKSNWLIRDLLKRQLAKAEPIIFKRGYKQGVDDQNDLARLDEPIIRADERAKVLGEWLDGPTAGGMYWMSALCDGRYISPRIQRIIDYARPERGLEVAQGVGDSIPVKTFCEEYYPKAKWLFIPEPSINQLKQGIKSE